ncbi:MAG: two-component system sensor histidine kinase NtrB [Desulfovibrionales bacterium]
MGEPSKRDSGTVPPDSNDEYCPWEDADHDISVGIVGTGPGFLTILDIIFEASYREFLPVMNLVGVAEPGSDRAKIERVRSRNIPVYDSYLELLEHHPTINFLIELAGGRFRVKRIRASLPDSISLIDHSAAIFLCGLHNMFQVSTHCQLNLDRHKALMQAIMDKVQEDIILLDTSCRVVDMNRHVVERAGKSKEELIGRHCWEVQTLEDAGPLCQGPEESCPFYKTLDTNENAEALLTRVGKKGRLHYFRIYSYPIYNEFGNMTHILVMRRDITERTHRERDRQQSEKLAVVGEMSMYLAHEIRNPLFAIGGFTNSLLKSANLDAKERDKVKIIAEEAKRLDTMLTSILNFAAPQETALQTVDLNRIASEVFDLMQIGYGAQGIAFELQTDLSIPRIRGDGEQIKQCLINLVKNSVEAMPQGGTVFIRTGMNQKVLLQVRDTGKGMSETEIENAFSPFFTTKKKGYGLGLAMIKKITEEYGGHVELASRQGEGTTVTLSFLPALAVTKEGK